VSGERTKGKGGGQIAVQGSRIQNNFKTMKAAEGADNNERRPTRKCARTSPLHLRHNGAKSTGHQSDLPGRQYEATTRWKGRAQVLRTNGGTRGKDWEGRNGADKDSTSVLKGDKKFWTITLREYRQFQEREARKPLCGRSKKMLKGERALGRGDCGRANHRYLLKPARTAQRARIFKERKAGVFLTKSKVDHKKAYREGEQGERDCCR